MIPQKIALLTDSCADLRREDIERFGISVVPLRILTRDGEFRDGVDITNRDVYRRLRAGEVPQTSLPTAADMSAAISDIMRKGCDGIIAVMLSSGLSGTYNLARLAAEELNEESEGRISMCVFDSRSGAMGQGMTVLQLARDIRAGMGWEELTQRRVPQLLRGSYAFFSVDTLEYLRRGGRIGRIAAVAGSMLHIKPVITFTETGELQSVAKVRGRRQVIEKLVEEVTDHTAGHKRYNLAIAGGGAAPEELDALRDLLLKTLPGADYFTDSEIDGTLSVYIGDGILGAMVQILD